MSERLPVVGKTWGDGEYEEHVQAKWNERRAVAVLFLILVVVLIVGVLVT